jgi:hypothetical protein
MITTESRWFTSSAAAEVEKGNRGVEEKEGWGKRKSMKITRHQELDVYKKSLDTAMEVFELTSRFPREEAIEIDHKFFPSPLLSPSPFRLCVLCAFA